MKTIESLNEKSLQHPRVDKPYLGVPWQRGTLNSGLLVVLLIGVLGLAQPLRAAEFICASGDVTCLIDAINQANANGKANRITLRRGTYSLTAVDNDRNGLPVITSVLTITGQGTETTIIDGGGALRILMRGGWDPYPPETHPAWRELGF